MVDLNKYLTMKREEREKTDPMPSSPIHPPIVNIFLKAKDGRSRNFGFSALHGARRLADFAISDRSVKWLDDNTVLINDSVTMWTDQKPDGLSQIMEHEFTPKERAWTLPHAYMTYAHGLFVEREPISPYLERHTPKEETEKPLERSAPRVKTDKPKRERPAGLVSLPQMLEGTDIDAKEARNALRKMGTPKPDHGRWEWPSDEAKSISEKIIAQVKKLRK